MLTKLDAVNGMLAAIGEAPVTSLTAANEDVATAVSVLDRVTKKILATGWSDNTEDGVSLQPTIDGCILAPTSAISIDTVGRHANVDVVIRKDTDGLRKLYDRKARSFVFSSPLIVRVVFLREFDELVLPLADYIAEAAAVQFQQDTLGSAAVDKQRLRRMAEAKAALDDHEAEQDDANILTDSPHCAWITGRNNPYFGR